MSRLDIACAFRSRGTPSVAEGLLRLQPDLMQPLVLAEVVGQGIALSVSIAGGSCVVQRSVERIRRRAGRKQPGIDPYG